MKKLLVVTVSALVAASAFAPVAQAKHRMKRMSAAPATMMAPMGNPRVNAQGEFYATPVGAPGPMGPMGLLAAPLAIPGAAVGGAADVAGTGLDVLAAPLR